MSTVRSARVVSLLEELPALGEALPADEFARARASLRAEVVSLRRGSGQMGELGSSELVAAIVLDGWLMRTITLAARRCSSLCGPGTVARPWDDNAWFETVPYEVSWRVLEPTRVVLLDERFFSALTHWPQLSRAILRGGSEWGHTQLLLTAVQTLQHVELRLRVVLWMYAERYGRATPEGVTLPIRLGHQDLAELIGTQRPSVSAHLAQLSARGEVLRRADRTWLLVGPPPAEIDDLRTRT